MSGRSNYLTQLTSRLVESCRARGDGFSGPQRKQQTQYMYNHARSCTLLLLHIARQICGINQPCPTHCCPRASCMASRPLGSSFSSLLNDTPLWSLIEAVLGRILTSRPQLPDRRRAARRRPRRLHLGHVLPHSRQDCWRRYRRRCV
jgi:hypothetical protein